ncbi:MAG: glutamate--tRNA ligase [Fervidicoccaceae archaeon]
MSEELYQLALKHALFNAYKHGGKASAKVIISKILAERPDLRARVQEVARAAEEATREVNSMSPEEQKKLLEEKHPELLGAEVERAAEDRGRALAPLPNAKHGAVVTRFAPNPDFVIHIGNSRVAILSHEYARMYRGKMILRFEDTDPRTKTPLLDAYSKIREDLKWLGVYWDEEYIQSLRMERYYRVAEKLIEVGGAYVDTMSKEEFSSYLEARKPYPPRERSPEENLELFDKMLEGGFEEGRAVVRVKTSWELEDPSAVDWVALRVIDTERHPHPLTGSKYVVWPTYNFAAAVDDHLMGVTHIIRGREHESNTMKQRFLYAHMGWSYPNTIHVGRLKLEGFIMSKSIIRRALSEGGRGLESYDDPRLGTLAALRRRGISPTAIRNIMLTVGIKGTDSQLSYANLASENRKLLDPLAPRVMFARDPVALKAEGLGGCISAEIPFHPDRSELGSRTYEVCDGDVLAISSDDYGELRGRRVRLMGLGNFEVREGALVNVGGGLEEARRERIPIIQWVKRERSLSAELLKPEGEELRVFEGLVEDSVASSEQVERVGVVQLVRVGFARIEEKTPRVRMIYAHD